MRDRRMCNDSLLHTGKDGGIMKSQEETQSIIRFEDVSFQYPGAEAESLRHINLDIKKGEFLVLTGGSGCGKTTLTRLINGIEKKFYEGTQTGRLHSPGWNISQYPL